MITKIKNAKVYDPINKVNGKIKDIEYVKEYYGYSNEKAKQALNVLTDDQINTIKIKLIKGGKHGRSGMDSGTNAGGRIKRGG